MEKGDIDFARYKNGKPVGRKKRVVKISEQLDQLKRLDQIEHPYINPSNDNPTPLQTTDLIDSLMDEKAKESEKEMPPTKKPISLEKYRALRNKV